MTRNGSQELELWVQKDIHREGNESHVAFHGKGNVRQEGVLDGSFYVQILQSGCLVTDYSSAASQKPLVQPTLLIVLSSDNCCGLRVYRSFHRLACAGLDRWLVERIFIFFGVELH